MTALPATVLAGAWRCGFLLTICALAGCAGAGGQARTERVAVPGPAVSGAQGCFYPRDVQDFRVLDRSSLIVYAPNDGNAYHVRLSPPSLDLRFAESLAFLPAGGRICGYAGERLIVGPPRSAEHLAIIDVVRLSPDSLQVLRSGAEGGAGTPTPRPRPGPGADVEGAAAAPVTENPDNEGEK